MTSPKNLMLASGLIVLGACSVPVTFYPVKGPYAEQAQKPIVNGVAYDVQNNTGRFVVTMPDKEVCEGK
jgi:hypothetical protein